MIELDGAQLEAGGQVLRSALALSICTQQPFRMVNIRISRDMPGLMRQHLGSREVSFRPRRCLPGNYAFDVGSGSSSLILQTVLSPLLLASSPSSVLITGSTHVKDAPAFDCLQRAFTPLLERMGARVQLSLAGYGFHPHGGGGIQAEISIHGTTRADRCRAQGV